MSEGVAPKRRRSKGPKGKKSEPEVDNPQQEMVCKDIRPALFPQVQPFPEEGILGMYPIQSACKREVAEHMLKFQKRLEEEYLGPPKVVAKVVDFKNPNPLSQAFDRVLEELQMFEAEVQEIRHMLAVEAIKKKYQQHDPSCPCAENQQ